jgi:hypothetical protein
MQNKRLRIGKIVLLTGLVLLTQGCSIFGIADQPVQYAQLATITKDSRQATQSPEGTPGIAPVATQSPSIGQPKATEEPIAQLSAVEKMYTITSIGGAENGASKPTVFTIVESWNVTEIKTYHWNNGKGVRPGTIGLKSSGGITYGPWQATGLPGQGGVADAYWVVSPQVVIPAGTYTVIDSDPATWAKNNEDTGGMGMSWGTGVRMGNP